MSSLELSARPITASKVFRSVPRTYSTKHSLHTLRWPNHGHVRGRQHFERGRGQVREQYRHRWNATREVSPWVALNRCVSLMRNHCSGRLPGSTPARVLSGADHRVVVVAGPVSFLAGGDQNGVRAEPGSVHGGHGAVRLGHRQCPLTFFEVAVCAAFGRRRTSPPP